MNTLCSYNPKSDDNNLLYEHFKKEIEKLEQKQNQMNNSKDKIGSENIRVIQTAEDNDEREMIIDKKLNNSEDNALFYNTQNDSFSPE